MDSNFKWFRGSIGSISSWVQLIQVFNWFKGTISSSVKLVEGSIGVRVELVEGLYKLMV